MRSPPDWRRHGIVRGTRTVIMVRPSPEFFLLMFALFKAGAVPVLVDPGIDRRALKQCLDEAQPEAFIGIPLAHVARLLLGWSRSAKKLVTVGRRFGWGGTTLAKVERDGSGAGPQLADTRPDDIAGILFTSGSTGVPKGVVYRHRHFVAQVELLRNAFGMQPGGVDLPTFPPFALFDPALGLTSIIPDMDPTRPASADPRKLHAAIRQFGVTQLFGSPALMRVLADHGEPLHGVQRVTSAGAPVPPEVVEKIRALLPDDAQFWTPYGATECLPVAVIEGRELQEHARRNRERRRHLRRPRGGAERSPHHRHPRCRRSTNGRTTWSSPMAWSARSPSPAPPPPTAISTAMPRPAPPRSTKRWPTAANASCTGWATSAISMRKAGCGSADARPSAWKRRPARCTPSRSSPSSTPLPT